MLSMKWSIDDSLFESSTSLFSFQKASSRILAEASTVVAAFPLNNFLGKGSKA